MKFDTLSCISTRIFSVSASVSRAAAPDSHKTDNTAPAPASSADPAQTSPALPVPQSLYMPPLPSTADSFLSVGQISGHLSDPGFPAVHLLLLHPEGSDRSRARLNQSSKFFTGPGIEKL